MKFLMLTLFIAAPIFGNWVSQKTFSPKNIGTVWMREADCVKKNPEGCFKLPSDFDSNYFTAYYRAKRDKISCNGQDDCFSKSKQACSIPAYYRVIGKDFKETYCTAISSVRENSRKKKRYLQSVKDSENQRESLRQACVNSLSRGSDIQKTEIINCLKILLGVP